MSFFSWMLGGASEEDKNHQNQKQQQQHPASSSSITDQLHPIDQTHHHQNNSSPPVISPATEVAYIKRALESDNNIINNNNANSSSSKTATATTPQQPRINLNAWRDENDPQFIPLCFGKFHKSNHRHVWLTEEGADAERKQREAEISHCHCALNIEGVINCDSMCSQSTPSSLMAQQQQTKPKSFATLASPVMAKKNPYEQIKESIEKYGLLFAPSLQSTTATSLSSSAPPRFPACRVHEIMNSLPVRFREIQWRLIFASDVDGFSLGSLYRRVEANGVTGASLLVAEVLEINNNTSSTSENNNNESSSSAISTVIGAFLSDPPLPNHGAHHFYGGKETFVFSFDDDFDPSSSVTTSSVSSSAANSQLPSPTRGGAGGGGVAGTDENNHHNAQRRRSSSHHHHHHHHHSKREQGKLRTHHHSDRDSSSPEHFIVCSNHHLGIGGGEDGASILFVNDLQRGTSAGSCAAFNHAPPLVGKTRHGLHHSEFKVLRMYLFALDSSSDFIQYLKKEYHHHPPQVGAGTTSSPMKKQRKNFGLKNAGGVQDDNDEDPYRVFGRYPCKNCSLEPRVHHKCNFIHDEFEKMLHQKHQSSVAEQNGSAERKS